MVGVGLLGKLRIGRFGRFGTTWATVAAALVFALCVYVVTARHACKEGMSGGMTSKCRDKCDACKTCERRRGSSKRSQCKSKCKLCATCKGRGQQQTGNKARNKARNNNKGAKGGNNKGAKAGNDKGAKAGNNARGGGGKGGGKGGGGNVKATYHPYDESTGSIQGFACQDNGPGQVFVRQNLLRKHLWTAANPGTFGVSNDWAVVTKQLCGKCAYVTNPANGKSGKFVIVDQKGDEGLDLSPAAFNSLDLSVQDGHSYVKARIAKC